ncbi:MAG: hypothetical protein U1E50_14230 [Caulobacteraceae bacterium]
MRIEVPELGGASETLWAVVLGALLATLGGFVAGRFEAWLRRRERERDAALVLGEIIFSIVMLLKMAAEARQVGDPYGPITMRLLRATRREIDAYERNREQLFDLTDPVLRVRIHTLIVGATMSMDGLVETTAEIAAGLKGKALETARQNRDRGFDFLTEAEKDLRPMLGELAKIARTSFEGHEAIVRGRDDVEEMVVLSG